jgi:hypothetical protein
MRLQQVLNENLLTEMPYRPLDPTTGKPAKLKMDTSNFDHFLSDRTLAEEWKLVKEDPKYVVYIRQDHTQAFIGERGTRSMDQASGSNVYITLDFKEQMISNSNPSANLPGAVQVDLVIANDPKMARNGYGAMLYMALVEMGLTIISDNTQYQGGAELWRKMAAAQSQHNYVINVIEDGKPMLDEKGQPVVYDGKNLSDDKLWSNRSLPKTMPSGLTGAGVEAWQAKQAEQAKIPDKTMTLFVMRKK